MKLDKDQFAELFMQVFPEQKEKALEDIEFFGEVLGHVFYTNMLFHEPDLRELLKENQNPELIRKYCRFIERMWLDGDDAVINIVCVSILEMLFDDEKSGSRSESIFLTILSDSSIRMPFLIIS